MNPDPKLLSALGELTQFGASTREDDTSAAHANAERARFIQQVIEERRYPERRFARYVPAALGFALLATIAVFAIRRHHTLVEFSVDGGAESGGGFVRASTASDAIVHFSDGSSVDLAPGTTGRVTTLRDRGARFSVEGGSVTVHVQKREGGADYDLDAGPYGVHVTGTKFDLAWNPATEAMRLRLDEGSVVVTGPHAEAGVGLRAGQTLLASADGGIRILETARLKAEAQHDPEASVDIAPPDREAAPEAPAPAATERVDVGPLVVSALPSSSAAPIDAPKLATWSDKVAKGDFASVLQDADDRGIDATTKSASLDDLMALADAARYGSRGTVAQSCLRAVRERFPGSRQASTAAFLLGRMDEGGNKAEALQLYDATIAEGGSFAAEALGRKMMLVKSMSGAAAAQPIARQYLETYPKGPYADAARSISGD